MAYLQIPVKRRRGRVTECMRRRRSSPARLMTDGERTDGDSIKSVGCDDGGGEKESELI